MKLYIPSYWGDINLESLAQGTVLKAERITIEEQGWLIKLLRKFKVPLPDSFEHNLEISVPAPWAKVSSALTKIAKGENSIMAMTLKTKSGEIEEVKDAEEAEEKGAEAVVATEVPRRGCPMPVYDARKAKEIRARRVLNEFLNPSQQSSFKEKGCVIVHGADSGHRYLVSHRDSAMAAKSGIVRDLTEHKSICAEKTQLPPSEELLALRLVLGLKGREKQWLDYGIGVGLF